jgi:hypothetical protein
MQRKQKQIGDLTGAGVEHPVKSPVPDRMTIDQWREILSRPDTEIDEIYIDAAGRLQVIGRGAYGDGWQRFVILSEDGYKWFAPGATDEPRPIIRE